MDSLQPLDINSTLKNEFLTTLQSHKNKDQRQSYDEGCMMKYILGYYHYVDLWTLEGKLFQLIFSPFA